MALSWEGTPHGKGFCCRALRERERVVWAVQRASGERVQSEDSIVAAFVMSLLSEALTFGLGSCIWIHCRSPVLFAIARSRQVQSKLAGLIEDCSGD
jgi:hypothetical protein